MLRITIEDERIETKVLEGESAFVLIQTDCGNDEMENQVFVGGDTTINQLYREAAASAVRCLVDALDKYNSRNPDDCISVMRRMEILGRLVDSVKDEERKAIETWAENSSDEEACEVIDSTMDLIEKILNNAKEKMRNGNSEEV